MKDHRTYFPLPISSKIRDVFGISKNIGLGHLYHKGALAQLGHQMPLLL